MAIQELNKVEVEAVSGGAALLDLSGTLTGLTTGLSGLLTGVLASVKLLAGSVTTFLTGLPTVGSLLASALAATSGIFTL